MIGPLHREKGQRRLRSILRQTSRTVEAFIETRDRAAPEWLPNVRRFKTRPRVEPLVDQAFLGAPGRT